MTPAELGVASKDVVCEQLDAVRRNLVKAMSSIGDARRPAVGEWTVGDTAAHLSAVVAIDARVAAGLEPPAHLAPVVERATTVSLGEVEDLNALTMECEPERDLVVLTQRIDAGVKSILEAADAIDWNRSVHWLGGLTSSPAGVLGHLTAEMLIHGRDMARTGRVHYPMPEVAALMFFQAFVIDVLGSPEMSEFGEGRAESAEGLTWEIRLRGTAPVAFIIRHGAIRPFDGDRRLVDVRITADAAAMLLLMFNRVSSVRLAALGRLRLSGRRPWRVRRLMSLMTMP